MTVEQQTHHKQEQAQQGPNAVVPPAVSGGRTLLHITHSCSRAGTYLLCGASETAHSQGLRAAAAAAVSGGRGSAPGPYQLSAELRGPGCRV